MTHSASIISDGVFRSLQYQERFRVDFLRAFFSFHSCIRSDTVVTVDGGNLSHHIVCMRTMTTWTVFIHIQFLINPWDQCILVSVQKLTFQFRYMHLTHFQRAGCWVFSKTQCCIVMCCSADTLRWRIVWLFTFVQIPTG